MPRRVLLVLSYLLLAVFVAANLRRPGIVLLGAGLLLNLAPILANGGLMPVTPQVLERAGYELPADVGPGDWVPDSKDVLKEREDARLWFLGDRLVLDGLPRIRAFSIGDVVIFAGLALIVLELVSPRWRRVETAAEEDAEGPGDA